MAAALDGDERAAGDLGEGGALGVRAHLVLVAVDHQHRAAHALADRPEALPAAGVEAVVGVGERAGSTSEAQPTQSSICLVECGSVNI